MASMTEEMKPRSKRQKYSVHEEVKEEAPSGQGDCKKAPSSQLQRNDDGDAYLTLEGEKKRVTVRKFHGKVLVDIREYYEKDGKMLPGKKGISLTVEQYEALRDAAGSIDAEIARL